MMTKAARLEAVPGRQQVAPARAVQRVEQAQAPQVEVVELVEARPTEAWVEPVQQPRAASAEARQRAARAAFRELGVKVEARPPAERAELRELLALGEA